ncbi:MAG: hypothetical protein RhofKO_30960 [Rhodothermales bacterium]
MDPNLHQKMGITHMNRVLQYAEMVEEDGEAQVHLTREDWQVVADTLFAMQTPDEMLPDEIERYELTNEHRTIRFHTSDLVIDLEAL